MKVSVDQNKPEITLLVESGKNGFVPQKFLIDTGFQGNCSFISKRGKSFGEKFSFYDLSKLPENQWIVVADDRRIPTFKGFTFIVFDKIKEGVEVRIVEADEEDHPVLGMEFLRQNQKHLSLDFKNDQFLLL